MNEIFKKLIDEGATPGINYCVINDNKKYIGSLGYKSLYKNVDNNVIGFPEINTIDTLYDIASLTKVVCTLTIIFRLCEKGKIKLDDKVVKYLSNFKYDDITIFDLLTHTSGMPTDFKTRNIMPKGDALKLLFSLDKDYSKGIFKYSDVGYILLGLVIEKVCSKSLDKVFEEEVAIPLNMKNTCFNPKNINMIAPTEVTLNRGIVRGFVHDEKAYSLGGIAGHSGLFADIFDLINFTTMVKNNGIFNGKRYLSEQTINFWYLPFIQDSGYNRSFSWYVNDNPNVIENKHCISFNGFTGPSISIDRENDIIIIMLTNRIHPTRDNSKNTDMRVGISDEIYNSILKSKKLIK